MGDNLQVQTTTQTAKWSIVCCAETNKWEILNDLGKFNSEAPSLELMFLPPKKVTKMDPSCQETETKLQWLASWRNWQKSPVKEQRETRRWIGHLVGGWTNPFEKY